MGLVVKSLNGGMDINQCEQIASGLIAGAAIDAMAPCYIKQADGLVYMSNGTGSNEAASVHGWCPRAAAVGQPVTLFGQGTRFGYADATLTPGAVYFLGATGGRVDTAATVGDTFGIAIALTSSDIIVMNHASRLTSATVGAGSISAVELAADAVETAKIKNAAVTQAKLEVGAVGAGISGLVTKFLASGNVIGGVPVIHHVHVTAGANGNTDVTLTHKTRVVLCVAIPSTTVAASTYTLSNVGDAITDAMVVATAGTIALPTTIDPTKTDIAAGTALRVVGGGGVTMPAGDVYVLGFRIA
jgi:hypothetical protein